MDAFADPCVIQHRSSGTTLAFAPLNNQACGQIVIDAMQKTE
jgi:hypothetical protein